MRGRPEFVKYLSMALDMVRLRGGASREAASDEGALVPGIIVLAIGGLAVATGAVLQAEAGSPVEALSLFLFAPVLNVLVFSLFIFIFHMVARLFGGKASYQSYYRAAALASIVGWSQAIPYIGMFISIWSIPVNVVVLQNVHGLTRLEAAAVIAVMMSAAMVLLYFSGLLG